MNARIANLALVVALLVAGTPVFARQATTATAAAAKTAHGASQRKAPSSKSAHAAPPKANAAIPEAERLAIQADLVWLGGFSGMSAEEFDGRTPEAIKAFQKHHNGAETGILNEQQRALLADAAKAPEAAIGWRLIDDSATGARVGVPEKLVPRVSAGRTGSRWTSPLGQIQIETFRLHEASLPALFEQEKKTSQRSIRYSALNPDSFLIVGEQHLKKFAVRAQSSGSEVRGVTILYDQATEGTMAPVAVAIADTFAGFPDPNSGPAGGHRRGVEYGSAIVVSDRGDLLAILDVTDECQSIMVPGFGHAERIAEDKANDLVLLRLYGARNLVPAAIAGGDATGADLTLFGVADPLAQAGAGAVNRRAAELTGEGLAPAPLPGFSGAAALDPQGHFAGIVALKSAAVAEAGPLIPRSSVVPAAAVRAFLGAQGVSLASGKVAMDQSVVRLICVRK